MNGKKRIYTSFFVFFIVFVFGTAGYYFFGEGKWTLLDSIYMTVITLSTVGYGEVVDLSANPSARIFNCFYILLCLGTIAYAVSSITAFIVEGELKDILGRRRMEKEIAKLRDHFIVCGSDETARTIIQELTLTRRSFVVVEPSKERLERLSLEFESFLNINGDPSEDPVLVSAGIERAKGIFLTMPSDEANLFIAITARNLNEGIRIVTKGIDIKSQNKFLKAGADYVVSPTFIGGMRMASQMIRPAVVNFLDLMLRERERILRFEEKSVPQGSPLAGKMLQEVDIADRTGALLVAIKKPGREGYIFNPPRNYRIEEEDILMLIASPDMIEQIGQLVGKA